MPCQARVNHAPADILELSQFTLDVRVPPRVAGLAWQDAEKRTETGVTLPSAALIEDSME
jgi:hypothetical protein